LLSVIAATGLRPVGADAQDFEAVVASLEALPYQRDHLPSGYDTAFPAGTVLNTAPAQDYTTGSIPGSPDSPAWPPAFQPVSFQAADGATLLGEMALQPGNLPAVLVVHGFNTHGMTSVIRWAAMLAANGYDVLAADPTSGTSSRGSGRRRRSPLWRACGPGSPRRRNRRPNWPLPPAARQADWR